MSNWTISGDDTFWVVEDPTELSELGDICYEVNLERLQYIIHGTLLTQQMLRNPTLHATERAATADAQSRLAARHD